MEKYIPNYPDIELDTFYQDIVQKYEFLNDDQEQTTELLAARSSEYSDEDFSELFFQYQNNIARFLSAKTIYQSLLLVHEMGTGKSGSAIVTAHLVKSQNSDFKKIIVLANGKTQINNFRNEVLLRLPFLYEKYKNITQDPKIILKREGFYFDTYRIFARHLQNISIEEQRRLYDFSIIILDEIHNLTSSSSTKSSEERDTFTNVKVYNLLYDFVHNLKTRKLLCLTGTPIRDKPQEISKIINIVIPRESQLPIGKQFQKQFLEPYKSIPLLGEVSLNLYRFKSNKLNEFKEKMKGYVSYLKKELAKNIEIEYQTNTDPRLPSKLLEHFKVYANIMKEPQNKIYLEKFIKDLEANMGSEETKEDEPRTSSLAYTLSRQTSLFAFPDTREDVKYVDMVYDTVKRDVTLSGKYVKTLRWTKDMRKLFPKDLPLNAKLERLSMYSCIYATIVREIIYNPSELVYIYSFFKSGVGIYVLASFLVEYFEFEIVRKLADVKTKSTTKRRLLILNHDFLSDTDLREMIDFFNKEENVLGEYIQVVIGTKQTKEGITLKNIRQIHIVQPDWNYADIAQAIARGIRVGSHDILLRKIGGRIKVRVFQHVSIPTIEDSVNTEYSIDLEQYKRAEIKDMNTKMMERQLLEASWDCYLNKHRNAGSVDYSRECEYEKCDYECNGIPRNFAPTIHYDTYNMYYSQLSNNIISQHIKRVFENRNEVVTLPIQDKNQNLVDIVLDNFIMNSEPVHNNRRDTCYLRYDNDCYFLVGEPSDYTYYDSYYNRSPAFQLSSSFHLVNSHFYERQFSTIINMVMNKFYESPDNHDYCRTIILQSPLFLQELLIENIILLSIQQNIQNEFFNFILNHYMNQARIEKKVGEYIVMILPDKKRRLRLDQDPLIWESVGIEEMDESLISEESNEFVRKFITENPYKYYGIIEISADKTIFKIRDVRDQELVFGSNKAKIPKGEVCANSFSRKKAGLINILLALHWRPKEPINKTIADIQEYFKTKEKAKLLKDVGFSLENISNDILSAVYILSLEKIPQLCIFAKERFIELDLIHTKRI